MNKLIAFCVSLAFLVGVSGGAGAVAVPGPPLPGALDIDFRDTSFDIPCNGMTTCTVGGVTVTPSGGLVLPLLDWTLQDGFGVRGGNQGDEIEPGETLTIALDTAVLLTGVWFTDMFTNFPGDEANVALSLSGTGSVGVFMFSGNEFDNNVGNGGAFGPFGGAILADLIVFTTDNANNNNDFAVAGLTVVPLPGALGLMISGLVAFVVMARRRRKATAA